MRDIQPTRDAVIHRHVTTAMMHARGMTRETFAADVVDLYHARTAPNLRAIAFHVAARGADVYEVQRANGQLLFRMLNPDGPTRLPVEIEEAVVLALPEPYRNECLRELANRYGLLAVPVPAADGLGRLVHTGEAVRKFGDVLLALAQTIGDGHLDAADVDNAPRAVTELDALIAMASSLREAHARLLAPDARPAAPTPEFSPRDGREV